MQTDLILEKQREMIVGLVIEDVFVLPSEFQAKSTSDHAEGEGENEQTITIDGFILVRSSNLTDPKEKLQHSDTCRCRVLRRFD
jgi:hypothetical protein